MVIITKIKIAKSHSGTSEWAMTTDNGACSGLIWYNPLPSVTICSGCMQLCSEHYVLLWMFWPFLSHFYKSLTFYLFIYLSR